MSRLIAQIPVAGGNHAPATLFRIAQILDRFHRRATEVVDRGSHWDLWSDHLCGPAIVEAYLEAPEAGATIDTIGVVTLRYGVD